MKIFDYIKANNFFPKYAPGITNYKGKMRGKNTRDKPLEFTPQDQLLIAAGIQKMSKAATEKIVNDGNQVLTDFKPAKKAR